MTKFTFPPASLDHLIDTFLHTSQERVLWIEKSSLIRSTSPAVLVHLALNREALVGKYLLQISSSFNRTNWMKTWDIIAEGQALSLEIKIDVGGQKNTNISVVLNHTSFNHEEFCILRFKETTNCSNPEALIIHQNKLIFENISDLVFWTNMAGRFEHVNQQSQKLLDLSDIQISYLWDLFPNVKKEEWLIYFQEAKTKKNVVIEVIGIDKIRDNFHAEVSLYFQQINQQEYICGFVKDITQRKRKEEQLRIALQEINALKENLEAENSYLQDEINLTYNFCNIISASQKYQQVLQEVEEVAQTNATVLILGETGTGKELIARAIHQFSRRSNRPLVKVNCAALPENLIESEFFGHERGAFTGAIKRKIGKFELANNGTIFLDEIGEMDIGLQAKLLRVLQEGEIIRIGSNEEIKVDIRIIAATNKDLLKLISLGKFRKDLYYRLNVFPIENFPLRERKEDIPLLIKHFIQKYNARIGKSVRHISARDLKRLCAYHFPGNIRELENIIERGIILSKGSRLSIGFWQPNPPALEGQNTFKSFEALQKEHIITALKLTKGKISGRNGASELLEINAKTLESKMKKFGIRRYE